MSTMSVAGIPADELAVSQRVEALQSLIAQAKPGASTASFAKALEAVSRGTVATATQASYSPPVTYTGAQATTTSAAYSPISAAGSTLGATTSNGSTSSPYDGLIEQAAVRNGVDPAILHGLIQQESGFDPNSTSGAGASGLTQLMPGTATSMGVANPLNPAESIEGGARYLSQLMSQFGGNTAEALAAYNAGPGAVTQYGGIPPYPETQSYVAKVLGYAETYRQGQTTASTTGAPV
jgi:soluble lytic murein transglycosylase-like protein